MLLHKMSCRDWLDGMRCRRGVVSCGLVVMCRRGSGAKDASSSCSSSGGGCFKGMC